MSKIRILAIPSDSFAVGKFRILNPFVHLQENYGDDFHIDIKYDVEDNDKEFENYDIIVAHSFIHNKAEFEKNIERVQWLKDKGKIVIIDIDDYWEPDFRHPMHLQIIKSETPKKKIKMLQAASYVTTTTPYFRDTIIKKLGLKNVLVFPNAVDETEPQFIPNPTMSDKIRFAWLGGSSHRYDLELLRPGIANMHDYYKGKVQFVLCGFDLRGTITELNKTTGEKTSRPIRPEESVWYEYEKIFTKNYNAIDPEYTRFLKTFKEAEYDDIDLPYRRRWTKEITKYALNYNNFDISLCPVIDNIFNNNKSQLKIIEAGFHKKAIIASESVPYTIDLVSAIGDGGQLNSKGNSLLVSQSKNHKQWEQHMRRLVNNPNMIEDLGNKLYETVKDTYSLNKVNKDRSEFLKLIINK